MSNVIDVNDKMSPKSLGFNGAGHDNKSFISCPWTGHNVGLEATALVFVLVTIALDETFR